MSPLLAVVLEYSAVILNIAFTILIGLERRTGWLFGFVAALIGMALYAVQDAWLMAALNGFYAVMGLYGWWNWGRAEHAKDIVLTPLWMHVLLVSIGILGTWVLVELMARMGIPGRYQWMEGFIASFAMVATWLMSRKALENWVYWTIGDLVAVGYNHMIGYDGYAILNAIYIALALVGFIRWRKQMLVSPGVPVRE